MQKWSRTHIIGGMTLLLLIAMFLIGKSGPSTMGRGGPPIIEEGAPFAQERNDENQVKPYRPQMSRQSFLMKIALSGKWPLEAELTLDGKWTLEAETGEEPAGCMLFSI